MPKKYNVNWQSCYSGTPAHELERLQYYCELAQQRCGSSRRAVEIGSHQGASAALLAEWFDHVICIDPWGREAPLSPSERIASYVDSPATNEHFQVYLQNMVRLGIFGEQVIPIVGTSQVLDGLFYLDAELIFVDDGHVYPACSADIRSSLKHLKPSGLLVVHDYARPGYGRPPYDPNNPHHGPVDPYIGVQQAVDEAITKYDLRIVDHFEGIVALEKV